MARQPGLIERFGGHAMAAGLSLRRDHVDDFKAASSPWCWKCSTRRHCSSRCSVTANWRRTSWTVATPRHCAWLDRGARCFPEPLFDGHFEVANWRVLKERHLKLELRLPGVPGTINAIHFGGWHGNAPGRHVHLAYRLACDDYRGGSAIQLRSWSTACPHRKRGRRGLSRLCLVCHLRLNPLRPLFWGRQPHYGCWCVQRFTIPLESVMVFARCCTVCCWPLRPGPLAHSRRRSSRPQAPRRC